MPLSDTAVRNAKIRDKAYKLADGQGMYLLVTVTGGKLWRWDYRHQGRRKTLALGVYPAIGLAAARDRRDEARKLLAAGVDPGETKRAQRAAGTEQAANSFEVIAREWHAKFSPQWVPSHSDKILSRLERDLFPWIGRKPIAALTAPELLACIRRVEGRGALETAHRALHNAGQVFRYAIATGRAERDVSADLRGALPPVRESHHASITDVKGIGELLRAIEGYEGSLAVKSALRLAPMTFVRPGELRRAEWREFDLETEEWNIPAEKMKMREPHLVPLSRQAVEILQELHALTGNGKYLFPSVRTKDRPMSENTVNAALRRMGFTSDQMTGHGFRAMARTVLDEVLGVRPDYIEHQLAHAVKDPNGRAYNRTAHIAERRKMMQRWADYLDSLKAADGGTVVPMARRA